MSYKWSSMIKFENTTNNNTKIYFDLYINSLTVRSYSLIHYSNKTQRDSETATIKIIESCLFAFLSQV